MSQIINTHSNESSRSQFRWRSVSLIASICVTNSVTNVINCVNLQLFTLQNPKENSMKPSKLYEALHALIGERVPLHIWGACGVGKSQIVSQVANDLDYDFLDVRAVQLDPVDLRGLPRISDRPDRMGASEVSSRRPARAFSFSMS